MYISKIIIENFRCFGQAPNHFELHLQPGLTALVGENDSGKTAVIDAIRFALGTKDQEWYRLDDSDFYKEDTSREIKIICKFEDLTASEKRAFVEYLSYGLEEGKPTFYVHWRAKDTGKVVGGRQCRRVDVSSGVDGTGPTLSSEVRDLLRVTYLRPLRDAEQALTAGRGSRLAQVLRSTTQIKQGCHEYLPDVPLKEQNLSVLGVGNLVNSMLTKQAGIVGACEAIDKNLEGLTLRTESLKSNIEVSGAVASDEVRLRELLEKLDLRLNGKGKLGLGSDNLLFMACELLLLAQERDGAKLLLIEEPEAHLHPQRQLQVMRSMQEQAKAKNIQVIVTTHSPNLASAIDLNNMVMIQNGSAFPVAKGQTLLDLSDYQFLKRFLDVTKANLFFARGVMIVEGDAENILLPTLASLLNRDFTAYGVSIVNVGGVGLRRYARIFQRKDGAKDRWLDVPVACVTDMDVMPDCAPLIMGKIKEGEWPKKKDRRWRARKDFSDPGEVASYRKDKDDKATGQNVKSFISDEWTLEYDLALGPKDNNGTFTGGLAEEVFVAVCLAEADESINAKKKTVDEIKPTAVAKFAEIKSASVAKDGCAVEEVIASTVYAQLVRSGVSKAIVAQYLAELLKLRFGEGKSANNNLRQCLPAYLTHAIDYVTGGSKVEPEQKNVDG
ncbi:MAG: AAA family ATPase [Nitrospira sp.]|nr:AAA family ATPase [Nitrospira sp.]